MKYKYLGLVLVICLSACSRVENYLSDQVEKTVSAIPTATPYPTATPNPTYTPIPSPTATPTLEPLTTENFDLSEILIEEDLPSGLFYENGLASSVPSQFEYLPEPDLVTSRYVINFIDGYGVMVVAIYNDPVALQAAIDSSLDIVGGGMIIVDEEGSNNYETYQIAGVGDEGYVSTYYKHDVLDLENYEYMVNVFFKSCTAFVDMFFVDVNDSQLIIDYAKKIDERIQASSACGTKD